jgi:hypothetical protein
MFELSLLHRVHNYFVFGQGSVKAFGGGGMKQIYEIDPCNGAT